VTLIRTLFVFIAMTTAALAMPMLDGVGPTTLVSASSESYGRWAPENLPFSGGLIFGKGEARFMVGEPDTFSAVDATAVELRLTTAGNLELSASYDGAPVIFTLPTHSYAVCPMAKHVLRNAPIAYTLPPYLDEDYLDSIGMRTMSGGGFIAREFAASGPASDLVRSADFWVEHPDAVLEDLPADRKAAILNDVNRQKVLIPNKQLGIGLTYFSGDFHSRAIILLNTKDRMVYVVGWPLAYRPVASGFQIKIVDVVLLGAKDEDELSTNEPYGPADFKSLFDLSMIFTAIRDSSDSALQKFIAGSC